MAVRKRIFLVDDEADIRRVYGDVLEGEGYGVKRFSGGTEERLTP